MFVEDEHMTDRYISPYVFIKDKYMTDRYIGPYVFVEDKHMGEVADEQQCSPNYEPSYETYYGCLSTIVYFQ